MKIKMWLLVLMFGSWLLLTNAVVGQHKSFSAMASRHNERHRDLYELEPTVQVQQEIALDRTQAIRANRGEARSPTTTSTTVAPAKPKPNGRVPQALRDCIARVENNGDYGRSSNPTHFGRYQFDLGTWVEFGGRKEDWGHASAAEQDRVFNNAMNAGATNRWTPYDPC